MNQVWGGNDKEAIEKVHDFFKSKHFEDIPLVPGALEGVRSLKERGFDLVVVTSRQLIIEKITREWIGRHFPDNTFQAVAFGNHWGLDGRKVGKAQLCKEMGASVLIDDSLAYTEEVASVGLKALLFDLDGLYGWNRCNSKLAHGVTRVRGWEEVLEHL